MQLNLVSNVENTGYSVIAKCIFLDNQCGEAGRLIELGKLIYEEFVPNLPHAKCCDLAVVFCFARPRPDSR